MPTSQPKNIEVQAQVAELFQSVDQASEALRPTYTQALQSANVFDSIQGQLRDMLSEVAITMNETKGLERRISEHLVILVEIKHDLVDFDTKMKKYKEVKTETQEKINDLITNAPKNKMKKELEQQRLALNEHLEQQSVHKGKNMLELVVVGNKKIDVAGALKQLDEQIQTGTKQMIKLQQKITPAAKPPTESSWVKGVPRRHSEAGPERPSATVKSRNEASSAPLARRPSVTFFEEKTSARAAEKDKENIAANTQTEKASIKRK